MNEIENITPTRETPEELAEPSLNEEITANTTTTKQTSVARSAGIVSIAVMFSRVWVWCAK